MISIAVKGLRVFSKAIRVKHVTGLNGYKFVCLSEFTRVLCRKCGVSFLDTEMDLHYLVPE